MASIKYQLDNSAMHQTCTWMYFPPPCSGRTLNEAAPPQSPPPSSSSSPASLECTEHLDWQRNWMLSELSISKSINSIFWNLNVFKTGLSCFIPIFSYVASFISFWSKVTFCTPPVHENQRGENQKFKYWKGNLPNQFGFIRSKTYDSHAYLPFKKKIKINHHIRHDNRLLKKNKAFL